MAEEHYKSSVIIQEIIDYPAATDEVSLREFLDMLGDRGFCLAILLFSLPNSIPVPGIPGFSTITGLPITFIALQMLMGRKTIWLPKKMGDKTFSRKGLAKLLRKAMPAVIWLEKFLVPRLLAVTSPRGERLLGLFFIVLSLIISLPIPLGNFLPGLSMSLLALGMLERDGAFLLAAMAFALGSSLFMYKVIVIFFTTVFAAVHAFF